MFFCFVLFCTQSKHLQHNSICSLEADIYSTCMVAVAVNSGLISTRSSGKYKNIEHCLRVNNTCGRFYGKDEGPQGDWLESSDPAPTDDGSKQESDWWGFTKIYNVRRPKASSDFCLALVWILKKSVFHLPDRDVSPYLTLPDSSFVKHKLPTCGGGSISTVFKGLWTSSGRAESSQTVPDKTYFPSVFETHCT